MKPVLRTLPLEQVVPGMWLGGDVCESKGAVLLKAGTRLDASHIVSLGRRGVRAVAIALPAEALSAEQREARRKATRAHLEHLFRHRPDTETDRWLHRTLLEYRMEEME